MGRPISHALFVGLTAFAVTLPAGAEPLSELKSFAVFERLDLAQLAQGEARAVRGAPMETSRFLSTQIAWVAPGTPAQVAAAFRRWTPTRHGELRILLHQDGTNFGRLSQAPNNSAVQALVSATTGKSPELQLSKSEAARLPEANASIMSGAVAAFWSRVLSGRARAFAAGGSAAQPPYDYSAQAIRPGTELNGLLSEQPKIRKQFSGLLEATGIVRGRGSLKPDPYWELLSIDGKGVLALGASYSRPVAGGGVQGADVVYYASGGFYVALTLFQMWPVEIAGKPHTLVWRGDTISSAELAGLAGIERLAAESTMMKDVSRAVRLFRRDTEGSR